MTLTSVALLAVGILASVFLIYIFSSLKLNRLRTIPKPPEISPETLKLFPAETRAGIQLHQACFQNDAVAANEALTMWAWANGESAMANSLDYKMTDLQRPEFREAIKALWMHLETDKNSQWFGDPLWNAFLGTNPKFRNMELLG